MVALLVLGGIVIDYLNKLKSGPNLYMSSYKAPERNTPAFISTYHPKKVVATDHTHSDLGGGDVKKSADNTFSGKIVSPTQICQIHYEWRQHTILFAKKVMTAPMLL